MDKNYLNFWEYKSIIKESISEYLIKYELEIVKEGEYGIELKNAYILILISYRYNEFQISFNNGKEIKSLIDYILIIYPDYFSIIKNDPNKAFFKISEIQANDVKVVFLNCLKKSFNFLDEYFSGIFKGNI